MYRLLLLTLFAPLSYAEGVLPQCLPGEKCVRKCCPENHKIGPEGCLLGGEGIDVPNGTLIVFDRPKCPMFYLDPEQDEHTIHYNGTLVYTDRDTQVVTTEFCLDENELNSTFAYICFPPNEEEVKEATLQVYSIGLCISIPFLLVTVIIYASFQRLRNLHGKCILYHTTCMLFSYVFLALLQNGHLQDELPCLVVEPIRATYNKYYDQGALNQLVFTGYRTSPRTADPANSPSPWIRSEQPSCPGSGSREWGAVMAGQPWAPLVLCSVLCCLVRSAAGLALLPKCCPLGKSFLIGSSGATCVPDEGFSTIWDIPLYSSSSSRVRSNASYNFTHKPLPCNGRGQRTIHDDKFWIYSDGSIDREGYFYDPKKLYCLEFFINFNLTYPAFCAGNHTDEPPERYLLMGIGFFFSVPFALATVIVYLWIKELHSLHGCIVVRNMSSFIVGSVFMGLIATRIIKSYDYFTLVCGIAGYAIQFFFMATFFWLNVMCFDIYWAFSGLRNLTGSVKERERKKLIVYSIYAWCTPLLILVITVAVDLSPSVPVNSFFKPRVGEDKCFFKEKGATWIYFYLPMALIILSNIILFGVTAFRIWSHRRETAVLKRGDSRKHDSTNDKESLFILEGHEEQHYLPWYSSPKTSTDRYLFTLYLKLFIVMGINWVMELLSSIVGGPSYLWYIPDFTNTLQGLFIFLIFVWKKRVRRLVWAKMRSCCGKETISGPRTTWSGASSRNTNSTNSTHTVNNSIKMNPATQASQTTLA